MRCANLCLSLQKMPWIEKCHFFLNSYYFSVFFFLWQKIQCIYLLHIWKSYYTHTAIQLHREIYLYMYLKCTWNCFSQYKRLIISRLPFCMKPSDSWSKRFFHCACRHAACILFVWLPFPFTGSRTIRFHRYPAYIPRIEYAMDTAVTNARKGRVHRVTTWRGTFVSDFAMIFLVEQKMSKPLINFKRAFIVFVRTSFLPRVRSRC